MQVAQDSAWCRRKSLKTLMRNGMSFLTMDLEKNTIDLTFGQSVEDTSGISLLLSKYEGAICITSADNEDLFNG
jgi:hypothetical protein